MKEGLTCIRMTEYPYKHEYLCNTVINSVAEYYGISVEQIKTAGLHIREVIRGRQIAMYLCREYDKTASLQVICQIFKGYDGTVVIHAWRKISEEILENLKLDKEIQEIKMSLSLRFCSSVMV